MMSSRQAPSLAALALCLLALPVHSLVVDLSSAEPGNRPPALAAKHHVAAADAEHSVSPELTPRQLEASYEEGLGDAVPDKFEEEDDDDGVTGLDSGVKSASADHKTVAARQAGGDDVSSLVHDQPPVRSERPPALVPDDASSLFHDQPVVRNERPPALVPDDVAGSSLEIRAAFAPAVMLEPSERPPAEDRRRRSTADVSGADGNTMLEPGERLPARDRRRCSTSDVSGADGNMMLEPGERPPARDRRRRSVADVSGADGNMMLDPGERPPARDRRRRSADFQSDARL